MKKSVVFFLIFVPVLVVFLFAAWVYIGLNGLPWEIRQTEVTAVNYIKDKYPDLSYDIEKVGYNSKFGCYYCTIKTKSELPIVFEVNIRRNHSIEDNYYEQKVTTEAKKKIVALIEKEIPPILHLDAQMDALDGKYDKYSSFIHEKSDPFLIDIQWKGEKMSLSEFVDRADRIRAILRDNKIPVCGLYIQDKGNEYVIDLKGREIDGKIHGDYHYTKEEILRNQLVRKAEVK